MPETSPNPQNIEGHLLSERDRLLNEQSEITHPEKIIPVESRDPLSVEDGRFLFFKALAKVAENARKNIERGNGTR